jgi:hypothetical protein
MSQFISVSTPRQITKTPTGGIIEYTISRTNSAYFGYCDYYRCLAIQRADRNGNSYYYKYWGFPRKSYWRASWGEPSWLLSYEQPANNQFGYLQGTLFESQTFRDEIVIPRGNSRENSKKVTVGVVAGSSITDKRFDTTLQSVTVYTTKIADASDVWLTAEVDPTTAQERYITVKGGFTNPEGHYNMRLFRNGVQVVPFDGTYTEKVTEDLYYQTINFELKIFGADGTFYNPLTKYASIKNIEPLGPGISVMQNSSIYGVENACRKNVTLKELPEIWIKKDGKVYKTEK